MPVPTSFDDLSEIPSSNSPAGSESVGPQANDYLQAAFAFIRQLRDGLLKPIASVDFNAQKITNILPGALGPSSKDVVRGDQMYKIGEQRMWHGAVANIGSVWGVGWQLADGTNGTADCRDKFIVGAGNLYAPGSSGGSTKIAIANLPAHNHPVVDNGHSHPITDNGHYHNSLSSALTSLAAGGVQFAVTSGIQPTTTNVTGITVNSAVTGITVGNTGTGTDYLPPYYASCIIEYTGIGA